MDGGSYSHDDERRLRNHFGHLGSSGLLQTITDSLEDEDDEERHRRGDVGVTDRHMRHNQQRHAMRIVEKPQLISPDLSSNFMMSGGDRFVMTLALVRIIFAKNKIQ